MSFFSMIRVQQALWYLLTAASIVIWASLQGIHTPHVELSLVAPKNEIIQLFCDVGTGFHEEFSSLIATTEKTRVGAPLKIPIKAGCDRLRLDTGSDGSIVTLLSATIHSGNGRRINILDDVQKGQLNDLTLTKNFALGGFTLVSSGNDPYVLLPGSYAATTHFETTTLVVKLVCLFLIIVGYLAFISHIYRADHTLFNIVFIGVLLRILYYTAHPLPVDASLLRTVWPDEGTYFHYTTTLLKNGLVQYFNNPASIEAAPGNVLYLASLMNILGGDLSAIRIFNLVVLSSVIVVFTFKIANYLFNRNTAIGAATVVAVYPELLVFSATILTEYLFIALLLTFIYIIVRITSQKNSISLYVLVGVGSFVGIFASITRLVVLPIIPLLMGYAIYVYFRERQIKIAFALMSLAVVIVLGLLPFFINGHKHSGHYMIATGSGAALWLGSRADTKGDEPSYRGKQYEINVITQGASHISIEGDQLLKEAGLRNIASNPYNYLLLSIKKVGRLLVGNNYFWFLPKKNILEWKIYNSAYSTFIKIFSLLTATLVAFFGICYPIIEKKMNASTGFVFISMAMLAATYLPFLVNQRYGLPIFVLNSIFAVYTINQMRNEKMSFFFSAMLVISLLTATAIAMGL